MREKHDEVIKEKKLPHVGQIVKSKKHGTLWRVIEKREVWKNTTDSTGNPILIPAIYLGYLRIKKGVAEGIRKEKPLGAGIIMGYEYTLHDNTFQANWECVE